MIPIGAPNTAAALEFLNFVYQPEVAANITEYVQYVTPVDGVQEILAERGSEAGGGPVDLPGPGGDRGLLGGPDFHRGAREDVADVEEAFQDVVSG